MCILCTDISVAVVDLLQEMTDVEALADSEEGASMLIDALVGYNSLFRPCHTFSQ